MCGLYGFVTRKPDPINIIDLERLAINSDVRGKDATGYSAIGNYSSTVKMPVRARNFSFKALYRLNPITVIAHNRAATHGDPRNNINNHPFTSKRFSFAHNGNLKNQGIHIPIQSECDSERWFRLFLNNFRACHSIERSIELTGAYFINQAFACSLLDKKNNQVYLFRNSKRPLAVAKTENTIYWASTSDILRSSISNTIKQFELCKHKIYTIDRNTLEIDSKPMNWDEKVLDVKHYYRSSISDWYRQMQQFQTEIQEYSYESKSR